MSDENIHPTAIVHSDARLGQGTVVGPYSCVGPNVTVGKDCRIEQNVILKGHLKLGDRVSISPFAVIGGEPQHSGYKNEPTTTVIGNDVIIREYVTVHRGTESGNKTTVVKDGAFLMAYVHVAHDCVIGEKAILASSIQLAGHVEIGERSVVGGSTAIAQHCRVGAYCYVGGGSILRKDLAPFLVGKGTTFVVQGINSVGLKRMGFETSSLRELKDLYRIFYLKGLTIGQAIETATEKNGASDLVQRFVRFVKTSKMGLIR